MFSYINFLQDRVKDNKAVSYPYCDPNQSFYCFQKTKYRYPGEALRGTIYREDMGNNTPVVQSVGGLCEKRKVMLDPQSFYICPINKALSKKNFFKKLKLLQYLRNI